MVRFLIHNQELLQLTLYSLPFIKILAADRTKIMRYPVQLHEYIFNMRPSWFSTLIKKSRPMRGHGMMSTMLINDLINKPFAYKNKIDINYFLVNRGPHNPRPISCDCLNSCDHWAIKKGN